MALDMEQGRRMLQLITSRYDAREWRKKIEKTLSLPPSGLGDETQRTIFLYLKHGLKAYKSRRADPDSWIVGGFATKEVIERAKHQPTDVGPSVTREAVSCLGTDPGPEVDQDWWEEMLAQWFEEPGADESSDETPAAETEPPPSPSQS
jgi:hypothetical protein